MWWGIRNTTFEGKKQTNPKPDSLGRVAEGGVVVNLLPG